MNQRLIWKTTQLRVDTVTQPPTLDHTSSRSWSPLLLLGALLACGAFQSPAVSSGPPEPVLLPDLPVRPVVYTSSTTDEHTTVNPASNAVQPAAPKPAPRTTQQTPAERFDALVNEAQMAYFKVHDYICTFTKQERIDGVLQPEATAIMSLRNAPFSVHLKFIAPQSLAGQEAVYVEGKHNGRMRVKSSGRLLSLVGFVTLDVNDPRVTRENRHLITEAGIGNMINRLIAARHRERNAADVRVTLSKATVGSMQCERVETVFSHLAPGRFCTRCVIYFDQATKLPVRFEAYERAADGSDTQLLECYTYTDLQLNVGLCDAAFNQ